MRNLFIGATMLVMALAVTAGMSMAEDKKDEKPKHTIKEVMKTAHKEGLLKKVQDGTATDAEKKKLADLYVALHENVPPKGSAESWKEKTEALVKASKDVLEGKKDSGDSLKKAANCAACHKEHKK
jgi:hypothetical protein